jgi:hypothetical protein
MFRRVGSVRVPFLELSSGIPLFATQTWVQRHFAASILRITVINRVQETLSESAIELVERRTLGFHGPSTFDPRALLAPFESLARWAAERKGGGRVTIAWPVS